MADLKHRITFRVLLITALLSGGCIGENWDCPTLPDNGNVEFPMHWEDDAYDKPQIAMRLNLFAADGGSDYGRTDLQPSGGTISLNRGRVYEGVAYNYFDSRDVQFREETDKTAIEAYSPPVSRATYAKLYPDRQLVAEPSTLYVAWTGRFTVSGNAGQRIDMYPEDVVQTYTFEVRGVRGAEYITATRGEMYGISASYFLMSGELAATPSAVIFYATADGDGEMIYGSFRTFGMVGAIREFTIEILYPNNDNGYIVKTWDVADQVAQGTHIIVELDMDLIPDSDLGAGFDVIVGEWDDEIIPIEM